MQLLPNFALEGVHDARQNNEEEDDAGALHAAAERDANRPDPLAELRAAFAEWKRDEASSNDVEQWLDEYLSSRGMASVLHA